MPSEDDVSLAHNLTAKLMRLGPPEAYYEPRADLEIPSVLQVDFSEQERDIYLGDVIETSQEFMRAAQVSEVYDLPFPCLKGANSATPIPMSMGFEDWFWVDPYRWQFFSPMAYRENARFFIDRYIRANRDISIDVYPVKTVREFFQRGMETFLSIRFGARQSNISALPGYQFEVETDTQGLTVVYGGANYLKARPFQAPTSPVSQWIQPGGWIFGVATSGPVPSWDPAMLQYNVPPDNYAKLAL